MFVPAAGDVCVLLAVFSVNGMVIVGLVRFTVSDSGKLALIVTVPVLEFNCATAGVVAKASAMVSSARIPRTLIERLMLVSFALLLEFRTMREYGGTAPTTSDEGNLEHESSTVPRRTLSLLRIDGFSAPLCHTRGIGINRV